MRGGAGRPRLPAWAVPHAVPRRGVYRILCVERGGACCRPPVHTLGHAKSFRRGVGACNFIAIARSCSRIARPSRHFFAPRLPCGRLGLGRAARSPPRVTSPRAPQRPPRRSSHAAPGGRVRALVGGRPPAFGATAVVASAWSSLRAAAVTFAAARRGGRWLLGVLFCPSVTAWGGGRRPLFGPNRLLTVWTARCRTGGAVGR